jgi:hypothetical protein
MKISDSGAANYDAIEYNERQGQFKAFIKKPQLDSLLTLIREAEIFSLKNNYSMPVTDHPTYTLMIKLKNGRTKKIEDYGPSGPEKLMKIYSLIFSLRETQDWK